MRIIAGNLVIALVVLVAQSGPQAAEKSESLAQDVKTAAKLVLSDSPKQEEVDKALVSLIDIANRIAARDTKLPGELPARLQAAAKAIARDPLDLESSEALNAAYRIVNAGKDFAFPDGMRGGGALNRLAQQQIDESVKSLESGQSDQAVRNILAFVLLVTTPVMK